MLLLQRATQRHPTAPRYKILPAVLPAISHQLTLKELRGTLFVHVRPLLDPASPLTATFTTLPRELQDIVYTNALVVQSDIIRDHCKWVIPPVPSPLAIHFRKKASLSPCYESATSSPPRLLPPPSPRILSGFCNASRTNTVIALGCS